MDEGLSRAVVRAFVALHKAGLIYRDKRLVNWDVQLQTAVSDLEVQQTEVDGHLWHLRYPIEGGDGEFITVATTRPETMLGDTGVAVHPDDERYRHLHGRHVVLPLVGRRIPIVADELFRPREGHRCGQDHARPRLQRLRGRPPARARGDPDPGRAGPGQRQRARGLSRARPVRGAPARRRRARGAGPARAGREAPPHRAARRPLGHAARAVPDRPVVLRRQDPGQAAIAAVEDGRTRFVPRQWENTYFEWMRNIQPWCISRQLWWGHQIPAWYGPDGQVFVEESEAEAAAAAARALRPCGRRCAATRTCSTPGSPRACGRSRPWAGRSRRPSCARFYPTDVLVTGFDIIFFWVARMMMLGLHFMGEVPFKDVYIHGLVRDERGTKMSKTKGNVVDPLQLIDDYGADALRLALLASTAQGRDVKFGPSPGRGLPQLRHQALERRPLRPDERGARCDPAFDPRACRAAAQPLDRRRDRRRPPPPSPARSRPTASTTRRWASTISSGTPSATGTSSWPSPCCSARTRPPRRETRATAAWALAQALHLLHPIAPFVTEELWQQLFDRPGGMLIGAAWPRLGGELVDAEAEAELGWLVRLIGAIRAARSRAERAARRPAHAAPAGRRATTSRLAGAARRRDPAAGAHRRDRPRGRSRCRRSRWWS